MAQQYPNRLFPLLKSGLKNSKFFLLFLCCLNYYNLICISSIEPSNEPSNNIQRKARPRIRPKHRPRKKKQQKKHGEKARLAFKLNGGRLGDNLMNYVAAKQIAYEKGIPFYYPQFRHTELLHLSSTEKKINLKYLKGPSKQKRKRKDIVDIKSENDAKHINPKKRSLYICHFGLPIKKAEPFISEIHRTISPKIPIPRISVPPNTISVAVHVRKGSGSDLGVLNHLLAVIPTKLPPDSYYLEQIKYLYEYFGRQKLYVYLFTDYKDPSTLASLFSNQLNNPEIQIDCRRNLSFAGNDVVSHQIIEDLFMMTQCDCLIRPRSSLSMIAQVIGDYRVVISPKEWGYINNEVKITQTHQTLDNNWLIIDPKNIT